jgi:hypothetical protein
VKRGLVLALLALAGCSRAVTPPLLVSSGADIGSVRAVVVVPAAFDAEGATDVSANGAAAVGRMLKDAVAKEAAWRVVPGDAAFAKLAGAKAPEERAGALAKSVQADAAIGATVARYRERVGSAYGATEGASVSLQVFVVAAGATKAQWRATYAITQEPLAYNLWNLWGVIRGGPRWLTAEELSRIGVEEAVDRFARAADR